MLGILGAVKTGLGAVRDFRNDVNQYRQLVGGSPQGGATPPPQGGGQRETVLEKIIKGKGRRTPKGNPSLQSSRGYQGGLVSQESPYSEPGEGFYDGF